MAAFAALDPRAQLAWLTAVVVAALFGGDLGLLAGAALASALSIASGQTRRALRVLLAIAPIAALVVVLDALAGRPDTGARVAIRLATLALVGSAFASCADGEALIAGLRALRVPYAITFVLVVGARSVPTTAADLATLRDSARLRGLVLDGPPWRQVDGWRRLLVPLLVDTVRRGLQLGEAMEARAFGALRSRTTRRQLQWRWRDTVALASAFLYSAILLGVDRVR
jgi:energy-coupling factor transporter transmembrane protein EcfT